MVGIGFETSTHNTEIDMAMVRKLSKGGSKTQNGHFPSKIVLRLKKVCYKVSLCKNCQRKSCRAFIGLTVRAKK